MKSHVTISNKDILSKMEVLKKHMILDKDKSLFEFLVMDKYMRLFKPEDGDKIDPASWTSWFNWPAKDDPMRALKLMEEAQKLKFSTDDEDPIEDQPHSWPKPGEPFA